MNIFSALFTGIAIAASPAPQQQAADTHPVAVASVQPETAPSYNASALTESDVALYLQIMRDAADHVAHATGEDKAALDYVRETKGNAAAAPAAGDTQASSEAAMLAQRAADLSNYDETIAKDRGVEKQYDKVKATINADLGGAGTTDAAADKAVLAPHLAEIQALQNQMHGFMNGQ